MRLPRPRLTKRRPMVAVAVVGALAGVRIEGERRWEGFRSEEIDHDMLSAEAEEGRRILDNPLVPYFDPESRSRFEGKIAALDARIAYHDKPAEKYAWAARSPWLPVWPDPPGPR
jgi:hypothetical protein